ncbi:MAG TPA: hypothetical protein VI503_03310 [Gaiellaceae bacterium]|nr:hypothetical protein [Gaiellaceae bacterium]
MRAVEQWQAIEAELPAGWRTARLAFTPEAAASEAAAVLLPLRPGRVGNELRIELNRAIGDASTLRNVLARLDAKRLWGTLSLLEATAGEERAEPARRAGLAESWDAELAKLPAGWRDLLCELRLDSSDYLPRAALLGAPLNPSRNREAIALRFRASSGGGYGTAAVMVRRCLERMDAEGITGSVHVLHGLSNTENVGTQGPVWRIAGRSV